ncbi:hypothetical protein C0995_006910 [Termitomyces sp. Mi166|nr:hypothetical protein C0995_006910 [Termitomyces sp. Mi166\
MPPKRKRNDEPAADADADAAASSTRATRSSTRNSNSGAASKSKATTRKSKEEDGDQLESGTTPPAKKSKTTKTSTKITTSTKTSKTTAAKKYVASPSNDDDVIVQKNVIPRVLKQTKTPTTANDFPSPAKVQPPGPRPIPNEPYSAERAHVLFKNYEDSDEPNTIGADGFARLCDDAEMAMEGALPLILAWQFGTKEMMKITEEEWRKGTGSLKISNLPALTVAVRDLEELLILDKPAPSKKSKKDVYDKTAYWKYSQDRKDCLSSLVGSSRA